MSSWVDKLREKRWNILIDDDFEAAMDMLNDDFDEMILELDRYYELKDQLKKVSKNH